MIEPESESMFSQIKDWLSFLDSLWGVGAAIGAIVLFAYGKIRHDRERASAQIHDLSVKIADVSKLVTQLEEDNKDLLGQIAGLRARDLQHTISEFDLYKEMNNQQESADRLRNCFIDTSAHVSKAAFILARICLDAFYTSMDLAQLEEADRFGTIATLIDPGAVAAKRLKAEVAAAIASSASASQSTKNREQLWDDALDLLDKSQVYRGDEPKFIALQQLGTKLREEGKYELAGAALRAAYRIAGRTFGMDNTATLVALVNVATNYHDQHFPADAKPLFEYLAQKRQDMAGYVDELTFYLKLSIAACDRELHGEQQTLSTFEALVRVGRDLFGHDNRWVLKAQNSYAVCLNAVDHKEKAEAMYRDTLEKETQIFGENHVNPLSTRENLAILLWETNRKSEAVAEMYNIISLHTELHGDSHPHTQRALRTLEKMRTL